MVGVAGNQIVLLIGRLWLRGGNLGMIRLWIYEIKYVQIFKRIDNIHLCYRCNS
jgi:hypothetical protein